MFNHKVLQYIACVVVVSYISVCTAPGILAAERQLMLNLPLLAQVSSPETAEEEQALRQIYSNKIQGLEMEMYKLRGIRKNLLTTAITAFSAGAGINFGVASVNGALDDISVTNPEDQQDLPEDVLIRFDDCNRYVSCFDEKRDAQGALDGIKGLGGGIFLVGVASVLGYYAYTRMIRGKQQDIDIIRSKLDTEFGQKGGLTPEYLQQNESVAALLEEVDSLKKEAGSARTRGEIFSRLAIASLVSGAFLVGVATVMRDIVQDISIENVCSENVDAKKDAIDRADDTEKVGFGLLGLGVASGVTSFLFARKAKGKEREADELENGLLGIAQRIDIQPSPHGVMFVYTYRF